MRQFIVFAAVLLIAMVATSAAVQAKPAPAGLSVPTIATLSADEIALATAPANAKIATQAAKVEASRPTPHQQFQTLALRAADRALKTTKEQLRVSARQVRLAKQAALVNAARTAKKAFGAKKAPTPKQKRPVKARAAGPVKALRRKSAKTAATKLMRLAQFHQFEHNNPAAAVGAAVHTLKAARQEAPPSAATSAFSVSGIPKPETPEDRRKAAEAKKKAAAAEARDAARRARAQKRAAAKAARAQKKKDAAEARRSKEIADKLIKADAEAAKAAAAKAAAAKAAAAKAAAAKKAAPAKPAAPVAAAAAKTATPIAAPTKQSKSAAPPAGAAAAPPASGNKTLEVWQIALIVAGSLVFFAAMFMLWRAVAPSDSWDELGPPRDSIL